VGCELFLCCCDALCNCGELPRANTRSSTTTEAATDDSPAISATVTADNASGDCNAINEAIGTVSEDAGAVGITASEATACAASKAGAGDGTASIDKLASSGTSATISATLCDSKYACEGWTITGPDTGLVRELKAVPACSAMTRRMTPEAKRNIGRIQEARAGAGFNVPASPKFKRGVVVLCSKADVKVTAT
jgi:hypothetical protein